MRLFLNNGPTLAVWHSRFLLFIVQPFPLTFLLSFRISRISNGTQKTYENSIKIANPQKFIGKCILKFLNTVFKHKSKITMVSKERTRIVLPYSGIMLKVI